ncbi:MAG: hypothetical protein ACE5FW_03460, partial [Candidatus Aenigmatarchaeota archaeon]
MNKFANKGAGLHDLILEFRKLSRSWDGKSKIPLGSVITKPSVAAIKAYEILLESNYNNIGFVDDPFNPKIKGTNLLAIEAKVLKMMNFLYHGNNCLGYITSGGTESNVMGLWL